jgi:hypothetical protein
MTTPCVLFQHGVTCSKRKNATNGPELDCAGWGFFMIDSIVGFFVAVMVSGLIYIVAHDYWGITDELIWSHSMIGADVLAVVCAGLGIRGG